MKRELLWLPFILVVLVAATYSPLKQAFAKEIPVNKNISFAVNKGSSYSSEIYNKAFVQVHIIVEKVSGQKRRMVWEKTVDAKLLNLFPTFENTFSQKLTVTTIFDKKEHLEVTYTFTYDSNGRKLKMKGDTLVFAGANSAHIMTRI